jgi:hypothetical protein
MGRLYEAVDKLAGLSRGALEAYREEIDGICTSLHDLSECINSGEKALSAARAIRYVSFADARPLLEDVLRGCVDAKHDFEIDIARSYLLNEHPLPRGLTSILHYLSDALLPAALDGSLAGGNQIHHIHAELTPELKALLRARRLAINGMKPQAIAETVLIDRRPGGDDWPEDSISASSIILSGLANLAETFSGNEIASLAQLIDRENVDIIDVSRRFEGVVARKEESYVLVRIDELNTFALAHASDSDYEVVQSLELEMRVSFTLVRRPIPGEYQACDVRLLS